MFRRVLLAGLLLAALSASPAYAQTPADCTVDLEVRPGPRLEVDLRCQSPRPLTFTAEDRRTMSHVTGLATTDRSARYGFDLKDAYRSGWTVVAVSIVATILSWVVGLKLI